MNMKLLGAAVAMALSASAAQAAVTTYSSEAAWGAAVGSFATENFDDTTLNAGLSFSSTNGNISGGVFNDVVNLSGAETTWTFASAMSAFGGTWNLTPGGLGTGLAFYNGATLVGSITTELNGAFFGFVSTESFTSVKITGSGGCCQETYTLENMVYAVPEPGTLGLLGAGLVALVGGRRRQGHRI